VIEVVKKWKGIFWFVPIFFQEVLVFCYGPYATHNRKTNKVDIIFFGIVLCVFPTPLILSKEEPKAICLFFFSKKKLESKQIQSIPWKTTTLQTQNMWPLLTGGRCSEVSLCYKIEKRHPKLVVAEDKWSYTQVWLYTFEQKSLTDSAWDDVIISQSYKISAKVKQR
jgi:hypothetical protein